MAATFPVFGLTSPEAGSDAASMIDSGVICKGNFEGREVLGLRLNWHKRYITLGPVATLLASPSRPMIPIIWWDRRKISASPSRSFPPICWCRDRPPPSAGDAGVPERPELGPRCLYPDGLHHWRAGAARPRLEDADDGAGRRPRHFAAVAVGGGRGLCRAHHGAYARIREQFNVPIGKFEGIEEPLARIAGTAYLLDARGG